MSIYYTGCPGIPDPSCSDCPTKELGRIRSIFLKNVSYNFVDITNPNEWAAAIQSRNVYVFYQTNGSLDMAEQLTDGFGNTDQDLNSYEFTLNCLEPNFSAQNCNFWNKIKNSRSFQVGYRTETQIFMSSVAATIIPKIPIANDMKSRVYWNLMFKFVQEDMPCPIPAPVGLFTQCIVPNP
jgi:hypothetical protein